MPKSVAVNDMKANKGRGFIRPLILNFGTRLC